MTFWNNLTVRRLVALSLVMFLGGCETFSSFPEAEPPQLPDLPSDIALGCAMVGVDEDALRALVEHREALARCRDLQARTADFYNDTRRRVEGR
jgi:hypothetical protein